MDNDKFTPQSTGAEVKEGHEESDLSTRAIVVFLLSLAFLGLLTFIAVRVFVSDVKWVSLGWWEQYLNPPTPPTPAEAQLRAERAAPPPGGEAKQAEAERAPEWYGRGGRAQMEEHLKRTFPTPRLQYDDEYEMQTFRGSEDQWLASTGKDAAGNIHIPVDRAMDLLVQRGLPPVSGPFVPPTLPSATPLVPAEQRTR
jgi:hypothetical protein